jgi:hypothetical protein
MTKTIYKITTSCTLISEYTKTSKDYKSVQDVYYDFDYCGDPKEIDWQDEEHIKIEVSEDDGKTWKEATDENGCLKDEYKEEVSNG